MKYVADDSTIFWAIGQRSGVLAKQAEYCGKAVEMIVPFEEANYGKVESNPLFVSNMSQA